MDERARAVNDANTCHKSQFSIALSARYRFFKLQPWIWMAKWMSKQMTGDINSAITVAKSPVIEDRGSETTSQQQRRKEIRFMSHMSQSDRTEKLAQNLRGENIGSQALSSLTLHLLHLAPFSRLSPFLSHAHRRKTQTFLPPPPGQRVNGPLILRSEDQSQQGSHVCQIKNRGDYANMGSTVHARAAGWIEKTREEGGVNARGKEHRPCNSLQ